MARYGEAFRNRVVARWLPPESAEVGEVSREMGVTAPTLERWREEAQSRPARGRVWTARGRLEAVITTAALDEAGKGAWCREHGVFPVEIDRWCASATAALAARHAVYPRARKQNPARWSGNTRNWSPIGSVTLNPERDSVIHTHWTDHHTQPLAA